MNNTAWVLLVYLLVIERVEVLQLFNQCWQSLSGEPLLHLCARGSIDSGDVVDAVADSIDIHHAAAGEEDQRLTAQLAVGREQTKHILLVERSTVVVGQPVSTHEEVAHPPLLFGCGSGSADGKLGKDLPRVGIDDRSRKSFGKIETKLRLADTRWSGEDDNGFLTG